MSDSKKTVIFYCQRYGSPTLTFLYRQALFVKPYFDTIVLTPNKQKDSSLFPEVPVFEKEITLMNRFKRAFVKLSGMQSWISSPQKKYFEQLIHQYQAPLIHAHFGPSGIEILPLAKKMKLPLLVSFHGYDISGLLSNKKYINNLRQLFKYAYVITVSKEKKQIFLDLGAPENKIFVNYYGVPLGNFKFEKRKPIKDKVAEGMPVNFLQVSSLTEKKGHKYTLEAFKGALNLYPNSFLTIGGEGYLQIELTDYAKKLGIENKVMFTGKVNTPQVIQLMNSADIFLHHSITDSDGAQEGLPNVLIEAMATGLIVISTFHAGIPELVDDKVNGFLVKEKDIPGYIEAIAMALQQNENIGIKACDKVHTNFNLDKQAEELAGIYKTILQASE